MSDDGDRIVPTQMDTTVSLPNVPKPGRAEAYDKGSLSGGLIADTPQRDVLDSSDISASFVLQDIEKSLAQGVLAMPKMTTDQFTLKSSQRSEFTMPRTITSIIGRSSEDVREQNASKRGAHIRKFDVESQALRTVQANALASTYQFKRAVELPYMRKTLALDYQKTNLLRDIVRSIGTLQNALVSKLDAVKVNTGSAVPRKWSQWKLFKRDLATRNRARVVGNVSDFIMDGWERRFNKYVMPQTARVSNFFKDPNKAQGINGLRRNLTGKLNQIRHSVAPVAARDDATGVIGKTKVALARGANAALRRIIPASHALEMTPEQNKAASAQVHRIIDPVSKLNPFARARAAVSTAPEDLFKAFVSWRSEYTENSKNSLDALHDIAGRIGGGDGSAPKSRPMFRRKPVTTRRLPDQHLPSAGTPLHLSDPTESLVSKTEDMLHTATSERMASARPTSSGQSIRRGRAMASLTKAASSAAKLATPAGMVGGLKSAWSFAKAGRAADTAHLPQKVAGQPDKAFFSRLFARLGFQVESVTKTVADGNKKRSLFERMQSKWHDLRTRGVRKNSYEDVHQGGKSTLSKDTSSSAKSRAADSAKTAAQKLASGDLAGAAGGVMSDLADAGKDMVVDAISDKLFGGAGKEAVEGAEKAVVKKGLFRRAGSGLKAGAKGVGRLFSRGASSGAKGIGRLLGRRGAGVAATVGADLAESAAGSVAKRGLGSFAKKALVTGLKAKFLPAYLGYKGAKLGAGMLLGHGRVGALAEPLERLTGKAVTGGAELGWNATKGAAKMLGRGGLKAAKAAIPSLGRAAEGGLAKKAGGLLLKGAKGLGIGTAVGIGSDLAGSWLDNNTTGLTHRLGKTATTAASWGSTGAMLGSIVPGIGTGVGAAVGAGLGALYENADVATGMIKSSMTGIGTMMAGLTMATGAAAKGLYHGIFGSKAKLDNMGRVTEKESPSILGRMNDFFFGSKSRYSPSGDAIKDGNTGLVFKAGAALMKGIEGVNSLSIGSIKDAIAGMGKSLGSAASSALDGLKNYGTSAATAISQGAQNAASSVSSGASSFMSGASNLWNKAGSGISSAMAGAASMLNMNENTNKGQIQNYLAKGGAGNAVDPSTTPWCAAFVNATLAQAGLKGTGKLNAASFLAWGTAIDPKSVRQGDVLIEDRGAGVNQSGSHVGLATGNTRMVNGRLQIEMLSGNSGNRVTKIYYDAAKLKIRRSTDGGMLGPNSAAKLSASNNPWDDYLKQNPGASQSPLQAVNGSPAPAQGGAPSGSTGGTGSGSTGGFAGLYNTALSNITNFGTSLFGQIGDALSSGWDAAKNIVYKMSGSTKENFKKIMNIASGFGDPHPEITAAQWALESSWGQKMSGKNNPFGQKATAGEPGTVVNTREVQGGQNVRMNAKFKDYDSLESAIKEHVEKWTKRKTQPGTSPLQAAAQIKAAGYATDPNYVGALGKILASNNIDPNKPLTKLPAANDNKPLPKTTVAPPGSKVVKPTQTASGTAKSAPTKTALSAPAPKTQTPVSKPAVVAKPSVTTSEASAKPTSSRMVGDAVIAAQKVVATPAPSPARAARMAAEPPKPMTSVTASKPVTTPTTQPTSPKTPTHKSSAETPEWSKELIIAIKDLTAAVTSSAQGIHAATTTAAKTVTAAADKAASIAATPPQQVPTQVASAAPQAPVQNPVRSAPVPKPVVFPMSMTRTDRAA
jgi:uncharacterized protein (TIGR02594 family)